VPRARDKWSSTYYITARRGKETDNFLYALYRGEGFIEEWNRLPQYVIDSSSVNVFKNRLDEAWEDMGIYS